MSCASVDIVAKTINPIVVPDNPTLNAAGNYEYTLNLSDLVEGGDDSACETTCAAIREKKSKRPTYTCDENDASCIYNKN